MSDPVSSIAVNSSGAWQILAVRRWGSLIHARRHQAFRLQETPPVLAGWNVWFDVSFLKHMHEQAEIKWPFDYRIMDIQSVFWFLSSWGPVSQAAAIQAVLKQEQEHRALPDARNTARLFRFLAERFLPRLHEDTAVSFDTLNPST